MKKRIISLLTIFLLVVAGCSQKAKTVEATPKVTLIISAAASLTQVMEEIKTLYIKEKPMVTINYNFGSSGALQQQIEQGATADLFFSAAEKQMNALQQKGLILDDTKINLLGNTVVLIVKNNSNLHISSFKDIEKGEVKKIALGEPKTVPVGQYTEEIFSALGIFDKVKVKAVYGNDVKGVLAWVEAGNVDAGVVYATDAKSSKKVKVVSVAGKDLYRTPVVYPAAIVKASKNVDDTKAFLRYLSSDKAKAIFIKYGFDFLTK